MFWSEYRLKTAHLALRLALLLGCAVILSSLLSSVGFGATPKDTLVIGLENKAKSSDPRLIGADANSQYLEELRFLPLISFDESGSKKNVLAEKIEVVSLTTVKVKLKKNVNFNNGKPVLANDVKATYDFIRGAAAGVASSAAAGVASSAAAVLLSPRKGAFDTVKSIEVVNDLEVLFTLKEPDAAFTTNLVIGILPKEAIGLPAEDLTNKGFESGPFLLKSDVLKDTDWNFETNPKFSAGALGLTIPTLSKLQFKVIPDSNTRYAALEKGDLDFVQNGIDADKVTELRKKGKFDVPTKTAMSTTYLGFNFKEKVFQNKNVRKALAYAINKEEILKFILQGLGEKADSMFPSAWEYHEADVAKYEFNAKKAEELLDSAGYPDADGKGPGMRFKFTLKIQTNRERLAVAKAIAAQLKKVGVEMSIEMLETATFQKQLSEGLVQAWIAPWTGYKDPDHLRFVFHTAQTPPVGGNRGFFSNKEADGLLETAREESVPEKRKLMYSKAQKILGEELPYIYLWYKTSHAVIAKNVSGYKIYADGRYLSLLNVVKK